MRSETKLLDPVNGRRQRVTFIGQVTTHETKEHRISYETASWYTLVDVPPGKYDVVLLHNTPWVIVNYHGICTKQHFVNRVFQYSSVHEPTEKIGKPMECHAQIYDYMAAEQFANNPDWELVEDWQVLKGKGTRRIFYKLSPKEEVNEISSH